MSADRDPNQDAYDRQAHRYAGTRFLTPAERRILSLLRERWLNIEMLDLGIGAGRTTYTFAALTKRYVGVDYSPRMIELARRTIDTDDERVRLEVADARDLSFIHDPVDFALFSFNGIDSVGHEDRLRILAEVRRVLRADGSFFFSSHSLTALPFKPLQLARPHPPWRSPLHVKLSYLSERSRVHRSNRQIGRLNKNLDLHDAHSRGWAVSADMSPDETFYVYYINPVHQAEQLREAGFALISAYDHAGRPVSVDEPGESGWLHYHCQPL
jgi:ubiquinone/menaquinone biosynthesis C-methylase UbiE